MKKLIAIALVGLVCIFGVVAYGAQQEIGGEYIEIPYGAMGSFSVLNLASGANDKVAYVLKTGPACTLTDVGIGVGAITTNNPVDVKIGILNATGDPETGLHTLVSGITLTASTFNWISTMSAVTSTRIQANTPFGIVISWTSTTGNNLGINRATYLPTTMSFPFGATYSSGTSTWTKSAVTMMGAMKCNGVIRPSFNMLPAQSVTTDGVQYGGTITQAGLYFSKPYPTKIPGACAYLDSDADYSLNLLSSDGTTTYATTGTILGIADAQGASNGLHCHYFDAPYQITAGTSYMLIFQPLNTPAATSSNLYRFVLGSAGDRVGLPYGANKSYVIRSAGGLWSTPSTTQVPLISPMYSSFADDVSTGGGGGGTSVW